MVDWYTKSVLFYGLNFDSIVEAACSMHTNGFNLGCNGTTTNGVTNGVSKHIVSATAQAKSAASGGSGNTRTSRRYSHGYVSNGIHT